MGQREYVKERSNRRVKNEPIDFKNRRKNNGRRRGERRPCNGKMCLFVSISAALLILAAILYFVL